MPHVSALSEQLVAVMADVHRRGWCDGTGGNFSCVLQPEPLQLLMAPSGVDKGQVAAHELIVVDGQAQVQQGTGKASAETLLHLAIVRTCGAGAVLHSHSQAGTLLSSWRNHTALSPPDKHAASTAMAATCDASTDGCSICWEAASAQPPRRADCAAASRMYACSDELRACS